MTVLKRSTLYCVVGALATVLLYTPAHAQFEPEYYADLALDMSPTTPAPNDTVRISARSVLLPLQERELVWRVNDVVVDEGVGITSIELPAGNAGSETNVSVDVLEDGLVVNTVEMVIRPAFLDLLWEAESYAPHFYRGRALPSAGTTLRLEALPQFMRLDGSMVPNEEIVFTWKRNGYAIPNVSGRGRSRITIDSPVLFGQDTISVEGKSADGDFVATTDVVIASTEPRVLLYERHPLFGLATRRALPKEARIQNAEVALFAAPYYAPLPMTALRYEWKVNNNVIPNNESQPNEVTIDARGSSGLAAVTLHLTHGSNFFLDVIGTWNLTLLDDVSNLFTNPTL